MHISRVIITRLAVITFPDKLPWTTAVSPALISDKVKAWPKMLRIVVLDVLTVKVKPFLDFKLKLATPTSVILPSTLFSLNLLPLSWMFDLTSDLMLAPKL